MRQQRPGLLRKRPAAQIATPLDSAPANGNKRPAVRGAGSRRPECPALGGVTVGLATSSLSAAETQNAYLAPASANSPWLRARLGKALLFLTICLIGGELVSRIFWRLDRGAPIWSGQCVWDAYYPQL